MTPRRSSHPLTTGALAVVTAATTLISLLTWHGLTEEFGRSLGPLCVVACAVVAIGVAGRLTRLPRTVIAVVQLAVAAMVATAYIAGSPFPTAAVRDRLLLAFQDAVESANIYAAPIPYDQPPVHPLLIAGGAACLLLIDILANTLRRVPLAGLVLLAIYSVPISMTGDGPHWALYALTALGFVTMLFLAEITRVAGWGPLLVADHASSEPAAYSISTWPRTGARAIGGVATALSVVVPILIPTYGVAVLDFGPGGGGGNEIHVENPMADLRRDLVRGEDRPLLRVTTSDPDPSYLRIAVLNRFSENEWSSGDRQVPGSQSATGEMPELIGVSTELRRRTYDYAVEASRSFRSTWLPTSALVERVEAPGDWRYDTSTMDFLASTDDLDTAGLTWTFTAIKLGYVTNRLAAAPPPGALVSREYTELPEDLDPMVAQLAEDVTAEATTDFEKAVALQRWFHDEGGFTYSTEVNLSNGTDDLVRFLSPGPDGRTGYCEQFAAAMAVLARQLGIPARVAVGFFRPDRVADDTYIYSSHDLHAWPELFFSGAGWVRFEPTPAGGAAGEATTLPPYTTRPITIPELTDGPSARPRDELPAPTAGPNQDVPVDAAPEQETLDATTDGFPWRGVGIAAAVVLLAILLLLTPRLVRARRRNQRGRLGPEEAWEELRDTALDLGFAWPGDRSPREIRDALVQVFGAPYDEFSGERPRQGPETNPDAVMALDLIVHALERLRYARADGADPGTWRAEVDTCVEALYGGATRRACRAATWWPRSVFVRPAAPRFESGADDLVSTGQLVDRVG